MPSEASEEVAADSSATHTPVSNPEGPALVEEVEQSAPLTTSVGPEGVANWADASEVDSPSLPAASTSATDAKEEEQQEAESLRAVLETIGVTEEVADDPVATEDTESVKVEPRPVSAELAPGEIAAEAAFSDLDRAKEETADDPVSSPSEHVAEVETTDLLGLDDTEPDAEGDPAQVESTPTVADPPGVATEATTADSSDLVPPPTSPNLVEPGTEPVRVGHSPAASSREPRRQRHRGSRGGQTTRWQEALREWWLDFEKVQRWLYNNSGGNIARGFWLDRVSLEDVDSDQKWFVCNFHLLQEYLTTSQLLALAYHIWSQYSEWAHSHGLDRRRGVSHGRQVIDSKILPPQSEINLNILGVEYPPDDFWDRYYRYQAPHAKPRPKGKAAAPPGGAAVAAGPKQPDHPPPQPAKNPAPAQQPKSGWIPTLRSADHPVVPAASATVATASVPVPTSTSGVAASGRDSAAPPVAPSPAAPPAKPRPVTTSAPAGTPASRKYNLPPPPTFSPPAVPTSTSSASLQPLPPPAYPPPSLPPPPQEAPPTREQLAARVEARGDPPPGDPPPEDGEEWVEEGEEEEIYVEDPITEVGRAAVEGERTVTLQEESAEPEEPEFPDFPDFSSPRSRASKRPRSDPPVPLTLVPRETRERIELNQEIYRARREVGVTRRPLVLRPAVHGYPETRIDQTGTWVRVADPPVASAPNTLPYIVPGDSVDSTIGVDPHTLPDSVWRDPSLRASRTVLATSNLDPNRGVVNVAIDNPDTESEGSEPPQEEARRLLVAAGQRFVREARENPVEEAEPLERHPQPPVAPPPKRQRVNIRITHVARGHTSVGPPAPPASPPAPPVPVVASSTASASVPEPPLPPPVIPAPPLPPPEVVSSPSAASYHSPKSSVPPWREDTTPRTREEAEVAEERPALATSPVARSRTPRPPRAESTSVPAGNRPRVRGRSKANKITAETSAPRPERTVSAPPHPGKRPKVEGAAAPLAPRGSVGRAYKAPPGYLTAQDHQPSAPSRPPKPDRPAPAPPVSANPQSSGYRVPPGPPPGVAPRGVKAPPKHHPKGVKSPPPGVVPPRPGRKSPDRAPPPLEGEQPTPASGSQQGAEDSGLAPHRPGRPLPEPAPEGANPEVAGHRPRHHYAGSGLVSQVVHVDASNVIICLDWHDTLDQALNAIGLLDNRVIDRFRHICRTANNRVEFHIVSYAGASKVQQTKDGAEYLISDLISKGIPFKDLHLARYPCGPEGKSSIVSALQAHCLVDDRRDICNEVAQSGCKVIRSEGRSDKELSFLAEIDDWLRYETVEQILLRRRAQPLKPHQFYDKWGGK